MALKDLFGRGVGFGPAHWIVTRGYGSGTAVVVVEPPSPHRLSHDLVNTALAFLADDGTTMSTPLIFTAGETGAITLSFTGVDGTAENLSTASAVTFTLVNSGTGVVKANAVSLTSPTSTGTAVWTRLSTQVDVPGDYWGQGKVTRADGTIGYYPDAQSGMAVTILKAVGT